LFSTSSKTTRSTRTTDASRSAIPAACSRNMGTTRSTTPNGFRQTVVSIRSARSGASTFHPVRPFRTPFPTRSSVLCPPRSPSGRAPEFSDRMPVPDFHMSRISACRLFRLCACLP
jgi:hypothetical protein